MQRSEDYIDCRSKVTTLPVYLLLQRQYHNVLTGGSPFMSLISGSLRVRRTCGVVHDVTWRLFRSAVVELANDLATLVTWQSVPVGHHVHVRTAEDRRQTVHLPPYDTRLANSRDIPRDFKTAVGLRWRHEFDVKRTHHCYAASSNCNDQTAFTN